MNERGTAKCAGPAPPELSLVVGARAQVYGPNTFARIFSPPTLEHQRAAELFAEKVTSCPVSRQAIKL